MIVNDNDIDLEDMVIGLSNHFDMYDNGQISLGELKESMNKIRQRLGLRSIKIPFIKRRAI